MICNCRHKLYYVFNFLTILLNNYFIIFQAISPFQLDDSAHQSRPLKHLNAVIKQHLLSPQASVANSSLGEVLKWSLHQQIHTVLFSKYFSLL